MKYYFYVSNNGTVGSLHRAEFKSDSIVLERWDTTTKKWVNNPELYGGLRGFTSDSSAYRETTREEAERFTKKTILNNNLF